MKKNLLKVLIIIIIGIFIGFMDTFLQYEGYWHHFKLGLGTSPIYFHIIYGIISVFLAILFHELGHFIKFKRLGIGIKAIYVLGFAFVKEDKRWKLRFAPMFFLLVGGIVIPEHIEIKTEADEVKMIDIFKKVLLAGPKASIIYGAFVFILWVVFLFTNLYIINGILFTLMIITSLMTILAVMSSRVSKNGLYGDFAAIKAFDKDELFRLSYLLQLTTFLEHSTESVNYLWPKIVKILSERNFHSNKLYANLLSQYLHEITFNHQIGSTAIDSKINQFLRTTRDDEEAFALYFQIIYYYESLGNKEKVIEMLNKLDITKFNVNSKVMMYYLKLSNHLLGFKDEMDFLSNDKNIVSSSLSWVYKPLRLKSEIKEIIK
ncbi:M50 family metallopeptidase [Acholeplasma granularum]|uniref:M50 family metallopeptidase n=1 Tax=Acholeplasma granularum TaxID=264635 RepID=UPI0004BA375D|nr:M50 family metallopeptidase [Acholeplasma granularum]